MIPRQELLPLTSSGCVIAASEQLVPVYIEVPGGPCVKSAQAWYRWVASCGAAQVEGQRSSHPDLAVDRGLRTHVCGVAS